MMLDGSKKQEVCRLTIPMLLLTVFLVVSSLTSSTAQEEEFDKVVEVGVKPGQMMYDIEEFSVPAGGRIKLIFDNTNGTLQHNLLILAPGNEQSAIELAQNAWSMQNPIQNDCVPESDQVLFATALLSPGEKEAITFTAPEEPGDHPYVCTMPGHAQSMNGIMHVEGEKSSSDGTKQNDRTRSIAELSLSNLSYQYYEGNWKKFPNFNERTPDGNGRIQDGKITLDPRKRDHKFGFVFRGKLHIPDRGKYQFFLLSGLGSRLFIDGDRIINGDTSGLSIKSGAKKLRSGTHDLRLEYFQGPGGVNLQLKVLTPDSKKVRLSKQQGNIISPRKFRLYNVSSPHVLRVRLPDAPARSIAVGLPSGLHYCFDPTSGVLRYAWTGEFLDIGPERGNGERRGGRVCVILGDRFDLGLSGGAPPLRIGSPDEQPNFSFRGYIRHDNDPPTMMYSLDDQEVCLQVRPMDGKRGVQLHYRFKTIPEQDLFFRINRSAVDVSVSQGKWINDSTIALPETDQFTISIVNPEQ